ncbi:hypothetical protein ElyMa_003900200 [Elysia marginata]|uniref:Sema domain-containing protein n=1 Tax=Elysia marginata TaxID=1093978 RepID=A0AAV4FPV4_9GAST|nr:hypothetical protein ElyMa_003900200 [Elysia marginata]
MYTLSKERLCGASVAESRWSLPQMGPTKSPKPFKRMLWLCLTSPKLPGDAYTETIFQTDHPVALLSLCGDTEARSNHSVALLSRTKVAKTSHEVIHVEGL